MVVLMDSLLVCVILRQLSWMSALFISIRPVDFMFILILILGIRMLLHYRWNFERINHQRTNQLVAFWSSQIVEYFVGIKHDKSLRLASHRKTDKINGIVHRETACIDLETFRPNVNVYNIEPNRLFNETTVSTD